VNSSTKLSEVKQSAKPQPLQRAAAVDFDSRTAERKVQSVVRYVNDLLFV
jgi:hypothetical protein